MLGGIEIFLNSEGFNLKPVVFLWNDDYIIGYRIDNVSEELVDAISDYEDGLIEAIYYHNADGSDQEISELGVIDEINSKGGCIIACSEYYGNIYSQDLTLIDYYIDVFAAKDVQWQDITIFPTEY